MSFRGMFRVAVLAVTLPFLTVACASLGGVQQGIGQLVNNAVGAVVETTAKSLDPDNTQKTKKAQKSQQAQQQLKQSRIKRNYNVKRR